MSINVSGEYDPGKAAYLRNPNWTPAPVSDFREVQPMPGTCLLCVFGQGSEHAVGCMGPAFPLTVAQNQRAEREHKERSAAIHIKADLLANLKPTPHLDGIAQQAARMESDIQRGRFKP